MADEADLANAHIERELAASLRFRRPTLVPCGCCHYCNEDVHPGNLFCNSECAGDWEHEQAARRRNGII
jgi:hypothetical protein